MNLFKEDRVCYRTKAHRFSPSFLANCLEASHETTSQLSYPNQRINFLKRSKLGKKYGDNECTLFGRQTMFIFNLVFSKVRKSLTVGTRMTVSRFFGTFAVSRPPYVIFGKVDSVPDSANVR